MLLGGRVSEALVLKEISTGASNDLERATGIVRKMITELGMSEELGPLTFGHKEEQVFLGRDISRDRSYSDAVAYAIDKEARRIIDDCYQKAQNLIRQNIDKLHAIAEALMEKETLDVKSFAALMAKFDLPADAGDHTGGSISLEKTVEDSQDTAENKKQQDVPLPHQSLEDELNKID